MVHIDSIHFLFVSCCCCTVKGYGKGEARCWSLPRLPKQGKQKKPRSGLWNVSRRYPTESRAKSGSDLDWVVMRLLGCYASQCHPDTGHVVIKLTKYLLVIFSIWQERIQLLEEVVDICRYILCRFIAINNQISKRGASSSLPSYAHAVFPRNSMILCDVCMDCGLRMGLCFDAFRGEKRQLEITPIAMNILIDASAKRSFGKKAGGEYVGGYLNPVAVGK